MALFKKKCAYCGVVLSAQSPVERMGKKFCSLNHANEYMSHQKQAASGGGCC
ncbi:MAG: hypothetical protein V3U09_05355 [Thermoplasmata archaeon]